MNISDVIVTLAAIKVEHGDVEVRAYPGYDTSYPVTRESIEYYDGYDGVVTALRGKAYVLITGTPDDRKE